MFVDDNESMNFNVENRFDHPLLADSLVVGNVDRLGNEAFDTREFFKGTIQDLRINGRSVVLSPVPPGLDVQQFGIRVAEENVIEVCVLLSYILLSSQLISLFGAFVVKCVFIFPV